MTALLLIIFPTLVQAQPRAGQQIKQAVGTYLEEALNQQAQRKNWQGISFTHDTSVPGSVSDLAACDSPLRLRPSGGAESLLDRQRFEISCPGEDGWAVSVTSEVNVFLPAVHARGILERGQTLSADDLKLERINIGKAHRGYFNHLDDAIGKAAKRRIRAGQTLTPSLLTQPLAVKRGQPVTIVASHEGIQASTNGEALADGQPGEVIRVRNLSSQKVIDAMVVEEGVVTSTF